VLLDGAHNPAGAAALARSLAELGVRAPVLVFGAMRGKHVTAVLRHLARLHPRPIFTRVADAHAHDPAALRVRWRAIVGTPAELAPDPARALEAAARIAADDQPVVVAGSLYLVGAVRALLTGDREEGS
ncbi:MAG: bifunctional folylpolyglutamate synthase/dihydrofolate synthase, partial [Chloroflexota bacterium]|nr:bifunctional folylpolyglutamate synthase/dihydrofolate synthase [Chloroflexota bacterium]